MGINLFMLGLMGPAVGLPIISPTGSLIGGAVLRVPATWLAGPWVRRLIDEAGRAVAHSSRRR